MVTLPSIVTRYQPVLDEKVKDLSSVDGFQVNFDGRIRIPTLRTLGINGNF